MCRVPVAPAPGAAPALGARVPAFALFEDFDALWDPAGAFADDAADLPDLPLPVEEAGVDHALPRGGPMPAAFTLQPDAALPVLDADAVSLDDGSDGVPLDAMVLAQLAGPYQAIKAEPAPAFGAPFVPAAVEGMPFDPTLYCAPELAQAAPAGMAIAPEAQPAAGEAKPPTTAGFTSRRNRTPEEVAAQQERIKKRRRESAQRSRARKNCLMKSLELENQFLRAENSQLRQMLAKIEGGRYAGMVRNSSNSSHEGLSLQQAPTESTPASIQSFV